MQTIEELLEDFVVRIKLTRGVSAEWGWRFESDDARDLFFTHMMEAK